MKAYVVSDCEWWAANSEAEARASYKQETGEDVDDDVFTELSDVELDREFLDTDENERPTGDMTTFRRLLDTMTEPGFLAACE